MIVVYYPKSDVTAANKELSGKESKVNKSKTNYSTSWSSVKWINLEDHDGKQVLLVQV
jgi:hypothetical protein